VIPTCECTMSALEKDLRGKFLVSYARLARVGEGFGGKPILLALLGEKVTINSLFPPQCYTCKSSSDLVLLISIVGSLCGVTSIRDHKAYLALATLSPHAELAGSSR
jgi:hypothetical protein